MTADSAKKIASLSLIAILLATIHVITNSAIPAVAEQDPTSSSNSDEVAAASGANRFVVWYDDTPGNQDIFFKRSTDSGATWKSTVNLSNNPGQSSAPRIAVSGSNIYVVWEQWNQAFSSQDIFFRRSTDNGATWKAAKNLSNNAGDSYLPQIGL